jgi:hypothetical protein
LCLIKKNTILIDVFIAWYWKFHENRQELSSAKTDIHFIHIGVKIQNFSRSKMKVEKLNLVFLARHKIKRHDLPKINQGL